MSLCGCGKCGTLQTKVDIYRNSEAALLKQREELLREVRDLRKALERYRESWPAAFPRPE